MIDKDQNCLIIKNSSNHFQSIRQLGYLFVLDMTHLIVTLITQQMFLTCVFQVEG